MFKPNYFKKCIHTGNQLSSFQSKRKTLFISIIIPLSLSAFTHISNPIGFPTYHVDEGHYMRRTMQVLEGLGPQESKEIYDYPYDHPFFGQIFLAASLSLVNFPDSLSPSVNLHFIEMVYFVPRVLMGILAVIDTFLVYKIADTKYNRKVAFLSSTLFAVMPLSRILRGILLDSIELPFVLLSILFAVYYAKSKNLSSSRNSRNRNTILILISGIFLGLAIFTKIPVFTLIPLVCFIILSKDSKTTNSIRGRILNLGIWFVPIILITSIWPANAISLGQFDDWLSGVIYQTGRQNGRDLVDSIMLIFQIDPLLTTLGLAGVIYSVIKKNYFVLLWVFPYLIFLYFIGWVVYFHWSILLPVLCIALSTMTESLRNKLVAHKFIHLLPYAMVSICAIFGFLITLSLATSDLNMTYNEVYLFVTQELEHNDPMNQKADNSGTTLIGGHRMRALIWIPKYVFNDNVVFRDTSIPNDNFTKPIQTSKFLIVADSNLLSKFAEVKSEPKFILIEKLYYNNSETIASFIEREVNRHSFLNMRENPGFGPFVEVRTNR